MTARGHVYKSGDTWFYVVWSGGKVVHSDNTGDWHIVYDACRRSVAAFDYVTSTGHRIRKSWAQVVEKAGQR